MKQKLVFQVDSGWSNGIVNAGDTVALDRIVQALQTFDGRKFDVYLGFNFDTNDDAKIVKIVDRLKGQIGFVVDIGSSDVVTEKKRNYACPANMQHGMSISLGRLDWLKRYCGPWLGGIRFHEMWTCTEIVLGALGDPSWRAQFAGEVPQTEFWQPAEIEPFLAYAQQHGLFAIWSEPWLLKQGVRDRDQQDRQFNREATLRVWTDKYPHTLIPTWANNLAGETTADGKPVRQQYWNWLQFLFTGNTLGWGLSNQPLWNGSIKDPNGWAVQAVKSGGLLVHHEPIRDLFRHPEEKFADISDANYVNDPQWADRGTPLPAFANLKAALEAAKP